MKKQLLMFISLCACCMLVAQPLSTDSIRILFFGSFNQPGKIAALDERFELYGSVTAAVPNAYRGAVRAMMAQQAFLPTTKYRYFCQGRDRIEQAVNAAPGNTEIRFLRFIVQSHLPAFLGYNNLVEDKSLIVSGFSNLNKDLPLLFVPAMIRQLLKSDRLGEEDKKALSDVLMKLNNGNPN